MLREFIQRFTGSPAVPSPTVDVAKDAATLDQARAWMLGFSTSHGNTGEIVDPYSAIQSSAVQRCLRVITDDVAKLPLHVTRELAGGGYERDTVHPVALLLRTPNNYQNRIELISDLVFNYVLHGNAFAAVLRDRAGRAKSMVPVNARDVTVMQNPSNGNVYYTATHKCWGSAARRFNSRDMIHLRGLSLDGLKGESPITMSPDTVGLAIATTKHAASYYRQGTQLGGLLKQLAKVPAEGLERIRQTWQESNAGTGNAHRLGILPLNTEWIPVGNTAVDAQLIESRDSITLEIAGLFGVPPHRLGMSDNLKFNNLEALEQQFINNTLSVICDKIQEALEAALFYEDERATHSIRFDFDKLMRAPFKERMEGYSVGIMSGVINRNEARVKEGLAPYEGGEEFITPMNMAPQDQSPNSTPNTSNAPLLDNAEDD